MRAVEGTGERFQQGGIELWTVVHKVAAFFENIGGNHGQDRDWTQGTQVTTEKTKPLMRGPAQERLAGPGRKRSHLGYAQVEVVWPPSCYFPDALELLDFGRPFGAG